MQFFFNRRDISRRETSHDLSRKLLILITAVILFSGCGESRSFKTISSISEKWLAIKKELLLFPLASTIDIESQIDDFRFALNAFFSSPIGSLYKIHRPEGKQYLEAVNSAAERLKTAVLNNDNTALYLTEIEIDASLDSLQRIDKSLSNAGQRNSFFLFLFFSMLVIIVILVLVAQYASLERAESRERQSLTFSRETIIAQEQERLRIAQELHDTVAHDILQLSLRTEIMNKEDDTTKRSILCDEVVSGQREIMKRIRNICENLIPPDFQRRRLGDALQTLCYNFQKRTNIECQIKIQKDLPINTLNSDIQLQCFRIVQECLTNIEKHSKAGECSVLVYKEEEGEFIISVSDDGKGFTPPDRDSSQNLKEQGCFGLWGMYERAAVMNGELTLESEPNEGTTVTLHIPRGHTV